MQDIIQKIGLITAVILPFWNIPLIIKMVKRKSSLDISMAWAVGVWVCTMLMFPAALQSRDLIWRTYNIINAVLFTVVFIMVVKYRDGKDPR